MGCDVPVLHAGLQVEVSVNRAEPLDDVNTQPLEHLEDRRTRESFSVRRQGEDAAASGMKTETHLSDDLIGALDEDLHRPPVVIGHPIQKPLKRREAVTCEASP